MKVAFYISGRAGRLMKYLKSTSPDSHESIKLVISDDVVDPNVRECLKQSNISLVEFPYNEIIGESNKERNGKLSDLILERLQSFGIDYCISFGSHILSGKLLDEYKYRLINFHPALLPMFPGRCAIDQAVAHGNTLLVGNTCHFIDSGVDTGPTIMQSAICLAAFEDSIRTMRLAWLKMRHVKLIKEAEEYISSGNPAYIEKMQDALKIKNEMDAL